MVCVVPALEALPMLAVVPALEVLAGLSVLPWQSMLLCLPVRVALLPLNSPQLLRLEYIDRDKLGD